MPAELRLGRQALTVLEAVLAAAAPDEGCALLLGRRDPWRILHVWPCLNVWEPAAERRRRFALDPREQLQAQKWARARGLEVLGSAHSHPLLRAGAVGPGSFPGLRPHPDADPGPARRCGAAR